MVRVAVLFLKFCLFLSNEQLGYIFFNFLNTTCCQPVLYELVFILAI